MLKFLLIFGFVTLLSNAWAAMQLDEVHLLDVSTSEKSITINRGEFDNYKFHDYAKFYIQLGDKDHPKIFLVGEGELVKCFPKKSFWYLKIVVMPHLITPQAKLLLLSSRSAMSGRSRVIKRRHVVFSDKEYDDVDQYLSQNQLGVPSRLLVEDEGFANSSELYEQEKNQEFDLKLETYERMKTKVEKEDQANNYPDRTEELYFIGNQSVKLVDILNDEDRKVLKSISDQYEDKNYNLKFGLTHGLYHHQSPLPDQGSVISKVSVASTYDNEQEERKKREKIDPRFTAKIKRDGINWSDDMDDDKLRKYFISSGIVTEKERRERVLNEREGHEFLLHYAGQLNDHTTSDDPSSRAPGYVFGISYDLHLARASQNLKMWSLQFLFETGANHYDIGGINVQSKERMYGGILNFYFLNNPLSVNRFIGSIGVGVKTGSADLSDDRLSRGYSYTIATLPTVQLLTKYRFHVGDLTEDTVNMGTALHAGLIYEQKKLSIIDNPLDLVNSVISVNEIKLQIGIGFYF